MSTASRLASASLSVVERRTIDRFVHLLAEALAEESVSVWLYGSRARGEPPHAESDVDLLVVTPSGGRDRDLVYRLLFDAASTTGANPFLFSVHVVDPDWIAGRREIDSFFIQEVDRDKLVLAGEP